MLVSLFFLSFLLFLLLSINYRFKNSRNISLRESFLSASLMLGLLVVLDTELLSFLKAFSFPWVLTFWTFVILASVSSLIAIKNPVLSVIRKTSLMNASKFELSLICGLLFIVLSTGIIAFVAPPNNWDSMTYHMSRVVHWIQNKGVYFYPSHIFRQLFISPWSGFVIANLQILSGGDRYANFVSWFSMIGSIMAVSLIAKQLGAGRRGQIFAGIITATIPSGILLSTNTKTDYIVSFWIVCTVYYIIKAINEKVDFSNVLKIGASLGLAVFSKATGYLCAFVFLPWFIVSFLRRKCFKVLKWALLIVAIVIFINTGQYLRNQQLFGNPFGPLKEGDGCDLFSRTSSVQAALVNVARHFSLHLSTPFKNVNKSLNSLVTWFSGNIGVNINSPQAMYLKSEFNITESSAVEATAGNLIHAVFFVFLLAYFFAKEKLRRNALLRNYIIVVTLSFLLMSSFIKWSPYYPRFHLYFFILSAPFMAVVLCRLNARVAGLIIIVFYIFSLPYILFNKNRPMIGKENIFNTNRLTQYFYEYPHIRNAFFDAAKFIKSKDCYEIGFDKSVGYWGEYSLWAVLSRECGLNIRIEQVGVTNISKKRYSMPLFANFVPCAIVHFEHGNINYPPNKIAASIGEYPKAWSSGPVSVYMQDKQVY